jgi:hypothetical protein
LDDNNKSTKKDDDRAEKSREEDNEIEKGDHLQVDQCEDTREFHVAEDLERMQ